MGSDKKKPDIERLRRGGECVRLVVGKLRPLLEAAEELERLGSLEQVAGEVRGRLDAITTEHDAARTALDATRAEARRLVDAAQHEASDIIAKARPNAEAASVDEAAAKQRLAQVTAELTDAEALLATVNAEIERVRDSARTLLGS